MRIAFDTEFHWIRLSEHVCPSGISIRPILRLACTVDFKVGFVASDKGKSIYDKQTSGNNEKDEYSGCSDMMKKFFA